MGRLNQLTGKGAGARPPGQGREPRLPDGKMAGLGLGLAAGIIGVLWLASGFFIVQEGQQAVVTSFGRFSHTAEAGFQYRMPTPFQAHEVVNVSQLQSVDVGRNEVVQATGLRDASMLTLDENIVDIRFTVQYRRVDAKAYLFENLKPDEAVIQAAESAVREIVGRSSMDSVLYEQRDATAVALVKSIQAQLDRLRTGIVVANVNMQSVQPPEQVQAAFDDAVRAGADRERFKNEGQAYANDVIPKAEGAAARLGQEAQGYAAKVAAQAEGDAERFRSVYVEYQKAPAVTRDRLYLETMQQVYSNVSKVMVESKSGSNMLYLPLDKLLQSTAPAAVTTPAGANAVPSTAPAVSPSNEPSPAVSSTDARVRDAQRSRERDVR